MNSQNKIPSSIWRSAFGVAEKLPPLKSKKNPAVAAACGFALGGLGTGVYMQSWADFFIPWAMLVVILIIAIPTGETLAAFTPVFWAIYGYRRVKASNAKLEPGGSTERILEAEVITEPPPIPGIQKAVADSRTQLEARLRRIDELLREGLLTPPEHAEKRQQIMAEL